MLLGCHFSKFGERLRLDYQGAIACVHGRQRPVRQAKWVMNVRDSIATKGQTLVWVDGHVGMSITRCLIATRS